MKEGIKSRPMNTKYQGFYITMKHGFHVVFENGYTVSVQFGPGNYCEHYDRKIGEDSEACGKEGSSTAECAVWPEGGPMIEYKGWDGSNVGGWKTPAEILELLNWAASQKGEQT